MDEITAILDPSRNVTDIINDLKEKSIDIPEWDKLINDYEPTKHKIVQDHCTRKDKERSDGVIEIASRIHVGLEKLLTKRMTEFMYAIPVNVSTTILKAIKSDNKSPKPSKLFINMHVLILKTSSVVLHTLHPARYLPSGMWFRKKIHCMALKAIIS